MIQSRTFMKSHDPKKPANRAPIICAFGVSSARAPNTGHAMTTARANAQQVLFILTT